MSGLSDIAADRSRRSAPIAPMEATVVEVPASADAFLQVEVDRQPGRVRECPWTPHPDRTPAVGDAALVIESDAGVLWAIAWWPNPTP